MTSKFFKLIPDLINPSVVTLSFLPSKNLNALSLEMGLDFKRILLSLQNNHAINCLILTADPNSKAFSAGGDLAFLEERKTKSTFQNSIDMNEFYSCYLSIKNLPFPTIAAINGHAVGAGACLSLACDLRYMAKDGAKIGFNFVKLGISPGMGASFYLNKLVPVQVANYLLLTGDLVNSVTAKSLGIVLDVVENDLLMEKCLTVARRIAANSPVAVRSTVQTLRVGVDSLGPGIVASLCREADSQSICYSHADFAVGLNNVKNKLSEPFPGLKPKE